MVVATVILLCSDGLDRLSLDYFICMHRIRIYILPLSRSMPCQHLGSGLVPCPTNVPNVTAKTSRAVAALMSLTAAVDTQAYRGLDSR